MVKRAEAAAARLLADRSVAAAPVDAEARARGCGILVVLNLRDKAPGTANDAGEIEANSFAAALLMPEQMIRDHLGRLPATKRREPETTAAALAPVFNVSHAAPSFRLINLGLTS